MASRDNRVKSRGFLPQPVAGAALTGFAIVPRHALGGADRVPPLDMVNHAIIVAGGQVG